MRRHSLPALTLPAVLALTGCALTGCAVGGTPAPGGEAFTPSFAPAPQGAGASPAGTTQDRTERTGRGARRGRTSGTPSPRPGRTSDSDQGGRGGATGGASGSGTGPGAATASSTSARLADGSGDATGVGTPAWADLVATELARGSTGWTWTVQLAAPLPERSTDDQVLDLTLWVDRDGDGAVDDEVLAQLGRDGWTTAYRDPEQARYGADSGVEVRARGALVEVRMPLDHLGGVDRLQWATSAELGTLAAMSTGTSSRDSAPDAGATAFPG